MYTSMISSGVTLFGMFTVFEIAPERNGCAAAIIRTCPMYSMLRVPFAGLNAQSNTGRCSSSNPGAPSIVSFSSM